MIVLFAGITVGFALGIVVAALLSAPTADPGCDHCVLADRRPGRGVDAALPRLTA